MLPDAGPGGGNADVEADAGGDEIGVDSGGWSPGFAVKGADGGKGIAVDSSCGWVKVFELAGDAEDAKVVAGGGEGRVALEAEPSLVLSVDGVACQGAVGAEAVEVLRVEIEVNGGDEQISLGGIGLAAVAVRSSAGHDRMRSPEVELILAAKEERRVEGVQSFDGESVVRGGLVDKMKSPAELAAGCDATDGGTDGIEGEEVDGALLGVVELKATEEVGVFAGLFGGFPVLGVSGSGCEQDEGEATEAPHDLTC